VLMVIEAMKMEHTITAPYAGTVQTLHFAAGDRVPEGSALLELSAAGD
jgi:3-methylcrotonyl-CoA carboxylase alpha subunit